MKQNASWLKEHNPAIPKIYKFTNSAFFSSEFDANGDDYR